MLADCVVLARGLVDRESGVQVGVLARVVLSARWAAIAGIRFRALAVERARYVERPLQPAATERTDEHLGMRQGAVLDLLAYASPHLLARGAHCGRIYGVGC
jgi:hypothetical protein